jgi:hypothetical protein
MTRRRLFYWYAQLKGLERSFDSSTNHKHLISKLAEIERIEDASKRRSNNPSLKRPGNPVAPE